MGTLTIIDNNKRKYSIFAIAGFIISLIQLMVLVFLFIKGYFIEMDFDWDYSGFFIFLGTVISLLSIILSITGIIKIIITKKVKGIIFSVVGLVASIITCLWMFFLFAIYQFDKNLGGGLL